MKRTIATLAAALELLGLGGKLDPNGSPTDETLAGLRGLLRLMNGSPAREAALGAIEELLSEEATQSDSTARAAGSESERM